MVFTWVLGVFQAPIMHIITIMLNGYVILCRATNAAWLACRDAAANGGSSSSLASGSRDA